MRESVAMYPAKSRRKFSEAARAAALVARRAKLKLPDLFGVPQLFVVRTGPYAYSWELRRFGGIVIERGTEPVSDIAVAKQAGLDALAACLQRQDLPAVKRQNVSRAAAVDA